MELVSYDIPKGTKEVIVMPIGDIQYAGTKYDTADLDMLKAHLEWGMKQGAYFLGMGDYIDFASPSNRQRLLEAALYDTAQDVIEGAAVRLVDELYDKVLKGTEGHWLGLLEGHHYSQLRDGTTTDQYLVRKLNSRFLGTCAYVKLGFQREGAGSKGTVQIWCHHGVGSGRIASPLNKLEMLPTYWDADVFLMGHQSKKVAAPLDRLYPVWNGIEKLAHRTIIIAGTGGFSKAYMSGQKHGSVPRGGYVEKGMMNPVSLGGIVLKIRPRWDSTTRRWHPDLNVEL